MSLNYIFSHLVFECWFTFRAAQVFLQAGCGRISFWLQIQKVVYNLPHISLIIPLSFSDLTVSLSSYL